MPKQLFECASGIGFAGRLKQLRAEVLAMFFSVCLAWVVGVFFVNLFIKASVMPVGFGTSGYDSPGFVRADAASQSEFSRTSLTSTSNPWDLEPDYPREAPTCLPAASP